ncbi:prenyltransferase [Haloarchaeobius salinus]|uniref:prenyltransferase n=1 Tax=Haloarchaeobius salinus TaxID=1198298 RepID=UPI00210CA72F|nr:prenyltransferase [Haloarchaeobius salinus]
MSRPSQLVLILVVYALGVALGTTRGGTFDPARTVVGALALVPLAASVHYVNEYADVETDAITERMRFSGGSGALVETGLPAETALRAALTALAVGTATTWYAASVGSVTGPGLALLAVVVVAGWAYSVGPRLVARGLGEVTNALLGGLVLPLYGVAVARGPLDAVAVLAVLPFAVYVFANLLATQWPDRRADERTGKRTLPTRWSPSRLRRAHWLTTGATFALFGLLPVLGVLPRLVGWSCLLLAPVGLVASSRFTRVTSPFPSVATMVGLAVVQLLAWALLVVARGGQRFYPPGVLGV